MSEIPSTTCRETGRTFATTEEARASEARFLWIQSECDAGRVPELEKGDVIYVETYLFLGHGRDDFRGGLAKVVDFSFRTFHGQSEPYVVVAEEPSANSNWRHLAGLQKKLRVEFGKRWSHPDPDLRPEFNEW
jgi:hypothetical protein